MEGWRVRGQAIKKAMKKKGINGRELGDMLGVSEPTVSRWINTPVTPKDEMKRKLCEILEIPLSVLVEAEDTTHNHGEETVYVPVYDRTFIACAGHGNGGSDGIYSEAGEVLPLPKSLLGPIAVDVQERPFAVVVEGDSMEEAGIADGATVVINPVAEVYDGDPALVCYGVKNEVAVKWVYFNDEATEIRSASLKYPPRRFTNEDVENGNFRILGKVMFSVTPAKRGE